MRSTWGNNLQLTIFGESHGAAIGMVVDGLPIGLAVDEAAVARDMARRAPGNDPTATARREADRVRIVSGIFRGHTTGRARVRHHRKYQYALRRLRADAAPDAARSRGFCRLRQVQGSK